MKEIYSVYECPDCKYEIQELEYFYAKFNYPCPRCKIKKLSDYKHIWRKYGNDNIGRGLTDDSLRRKKEI